VNLTHNGLKNNKKHLYRLTEPAFVAEVLADFEKEWLTAEPVTEKEISLMLDSDRKRQTQKRDQSMSRPFASDNNRLGEGTSGFENECGSWYGLPCKDYKDPRDLDQEKRRFASWSRLLRPGDKGQVVGYFNDDPDPLQTNEFSTAAGSSRHP
jgi:hypothetical protein